MWPFKKKEKPKRSMTMFDMDKVRALDALTPEQIVALVCNSWSLVPERAVLQTLSDCLKPLTKQVEV